MIVQFTILHKKTHVVNRFSRFGNFFLHFFEIGSDEGEKRPIFPEKAHVGALIEIRYRRSA